MANFVKRVEEYFFLSRPYSVVNVVLLATFVSFLVNGGFVFTFFIRDVCLSVFMWVGSLFFNELIQNEKGRPKIDRVFLWFSLFFPIAVALVVNYSAVGFVILSYVSSYVYATKNYRKIFSEFVFLFRGLVEVSIYATIVSLYGLSVGEHLFFLIPLYLLTVSRNLVGDLRDVKTDQSTLAVKRGVLATKIVSLVFLFAAVALSPSLIVAFPLMVLIPLMLLDNAYLTHRIFIVGTTFYFGNFILTLLSTPGIVVLFQQGLFLSVLANFTYGYVKRSSDKYSRGENHESHVRI